MAWRNGRILITGVAGFLGSHLLDRLLDAGHAVVGIDNLSMGSLRNIEHRLSAGRFQFLKRDITRPETFEDLTGNFSAVVHLAAFKIPRYGKAIDTLRINFHGTDQVLQFAARTACKCVLASTTDIYGRNPRVPFTEQSESIIGSSKVARWAYAVSKLFDEHLAFAYQESHGIPVTVLRFFGSYGPRQHRSWWGGPQSVFIDCVLGGRPMPIHGDGLQTRSFTYVEDTVEAVVAAITREEANGEVLNIGSNREISIVELASMIHRIAGAPGSARLEFVPYESFTGRPYEDVRRRVPDVSLCDRLLDVRARISLEEGLRRTIEWQRAVSAVAASA